MFHHTLLLQSEAKPDKPDAVTAGRQLAVKRATAHLIHPKDGKVGERRTYPCARS
ncbi:DUF2188 domain-containing protein [Amycolatopsis sp. NBC_00438]|uniref:DUF2188 domain-containing protein n=1 Tax=Amycolatopsis sp. NBC_00438 TaxID=2903558 RepID=UPI002E241FCF